MALKKDMRKQWRRQHKRKRIDCIQVKDLTTTDDYGVVVRRAVIVDASVMGFCLEVDRSDLCDDLRGQLDLSSLLGRSVVLNLPQMMLDLDGFIVRTQHKGQGIFQIVVEFAQSTPEYWRQSLCELLPGPGELDSLYNNMPKFRVK